MLNSPFPPKARTEPRPPEGSKCPAVAFCRIQAKSKTRPELDGWWFRAFEYKRWDYWASNADAGWGAWSTETGWTQAWIASVLGMRQANTSLWELTAKSAIGKHLNKLLPVLFPAE